jgi:hypothetical protein
MPYNEKVLIIAGGGGGLPTLIINHIKFKDTITYIYFQRLAKLRIKFVGVHIRNTDRKTDVELFIKENHKNLSEKIIFLATDDKSSIELFKKTYKQNCFHFSNIPNNSINKNSIHYRHGNVNQETFIVDCITDILLLSSSVQLYTPCIESGYGKLAQYIFKNKTLLHSLVTNN